MLKAGELVAYKGSIYRVNSFINRVEVAPVLVEGEDDFIEDLFNDFLEEEKQYRKDQGLPHTTKYELRYGFAVDATHVSLTGVGGAIAKISDVVSTGKMVEWSDEMIQELQYKAWMKGKVNLSLNIYEWE